jgi:peptidoglycan/LPS O-acetylase OafA/YrhL
MYYALFLQNIDMSVHNVWGSFPLGITWSLAIEEQFYLMPPLLIRFLNRRALLRFILIARASAPFLRTSFFTAIPPISLPGTHSCLTGRTPSSSVCSALVLFATRSGVAGCAWLIWAWRAPSYWHHLMASVGLTWMALSYLAFLLYTLLYLDSRISRCLQWNWLRALGVIACGTYLFHEFFLGMSFGRAPWLRSWHNIGLSFIILIVTIAFCQLSWVYFEKPLVKMDHRMSYKFDAPEVSGTV